MTVRKTIKAQRRTKWAIHSVNKKTDNPSYMNVIARTKISAVNKFHRLKPNSTITSIHKKSGKKK